MNPTNLDFMNDYSGFFKRFIAICRPTNLDYGAAYSGNLSCMMPNMTAALTRWNVEITMIATRTPSSSQCCRATVSRTTAEPNATICVGWSHVCPCLPRGSSGVRTTITILFPQCLRKPSVCWSIRRPRYRPRDGFNSLSGIGCRRSRVSRCRTDCTCDARKYDPYSRQSAEQRQATRRSVQVSGGDPRWSSGHELWHSQRLFLSAANSQS